MDDRKHQRQLSDDDFVLEARLHPDQPPVKSVVVGDERSTFGRRLGLLAVALLLLFFSINGYIQSSQNGRRLTQARNDRTNLVQSVRNLTSVTKDQNDYILLLQRAIREQNDLLDELRLPTVRVPQARLDGKDISDADSRRVPENTEARGSSDPEPASPRRDDPQRDRRDRNGRDPQPDPPRKPDPPDEPPPEPPKDGPIDGVLDQACELTGICVN